jgi:alkanesulfonate monooxygenase SsuD/methylene tetrahydromethanopterin reductase-like flavin-dependent oxidoreductase (luciferase family)
MRVMGQHPMPLKGFREYLRVVRALLNGEAVDYTFGGVTREITFLHRDHQLRPPDAQGSR